MRSKQQSPSRVIIMHLSLDQRLLRPHLVNDTHEVSNRKLLVFLHGYGAQVGIGCGAQTEPNVSYGNLREQTKRDAR